MMSFFGKGEPIILKEGSSAQAQIEALKSLRGTLPRSAEKQLEADIRALRAGIAGEDRILFELKNSHMDMVVLQDIFLEHEGLTAQIDFLVFTRQRNFVIECKNLYGNIEVNERGDFVRILPGRRREGMYSPITQNQRHIELIRAIRRAGWSTIENALFDSDRDFYDLYRSFVVLANPKTVLDDRKAPADVRSKIIRADRLIESIRAVNAERGPYHDKSLMSVVKKAGERYLELDRGASSVDYAAKYRAMADEDLTLPVRIVVEAPVAEPHVEADTVVDVPSGQGSRISATPQLPADQELPTSAMPQMSTEREPQPAEPSQVTDAQELPATEPSPAPAERGVRVSVVPSTPSCPRCGAPMVLRTAKRGARAGRQFYGCSTYPKCRGIVNVDGADS